MEEHVDLVVVGGGPTGLLSALLARRLGLTVSIVDAKSGPLDLGRADALNARTQQYFEVVGILDELIPQSLKCNTSSTFGDGQWKSRQNKWWVSLEHCLHKNFLMIGQPVVERIMTERLKELKTSVHYSENVCGIEESDDSVSVTTDLGRKIHAKYALAADGARSTIRNALGISFTGTKPEMLWAVLDTFIETDFPVSPEIVTFELNGQARVSWIPRERGMARFYVLLEGEVTQERAENSIREHLAPHKVEFKKTEWFSTFDVKERIAGTFVTKEGQGRILLAGDAAHVHSVNGGQGLNTGIADSFALSWRVAMAVKNKGLTPDGALKLIRSYDTERRTVAQNVIDVAAALVRDTVRTATKYVSTIEKNAGYITGMGVSYDEVGSELIQVSSRGLWIAGKRCPDFELTPATDGSKEASRLYSMVEYGKYLIFAIGRPLDPHITSSFKDVSRVLTLLPASSGVTQPTEDVFKSELIGPDESFTVVIRPDMYIGYVGDEQGWKDYMSRVFA
ncbi:fad monooxygenase [Diaporthe amygdali]|uniref:fad monooxygenase n=1 Tax=Phomopsis amygdali TaxID=1214568 RepID=UPI0022FE4A5C|nr:fad monooxygenase [Diaporthe amygdali]KAJ0124264.1 fad monooxygenase [Diaporthe amygdali]